MTLPYVVPQDLTPSLSLPFNSRDTPLHLTWGNLSSRHLASRQSTLSRLWYPLDFSYLVHCSTVLFTTLTMAPRKSLKKCKCPVCVDMGGPDGCNWNSVPYRGHQARVRAESASVSSPVSADAIAAAGDELFISNFTDGRVTTLPLSADTTVDALTAWLSTSLHSTNNESSCVKTELAMPPLAETSDDEDDEPLTPAQSSLRSQRRKTHGKIHLRDHTILENVQSKISECVHQLLPSPDRLQETKTTVLQCRTAVNKITSKHLDIISLKNTVLTLLGNLEARWLALSSLVPDDGPLEYSTGKI